MDIKEQISNIVDQIKENDSLKEIGVVNTIAIYHLDILKIS